MIGRTATIGDKVTGKLIACEGIDGSGKSYQTERLVVSLKEMGYDAIGTAEPTGGPIGKEIREKYLSGKARIDPMELQRKFTEDRMWHIEQIRPRLEEGAIVVTDRYYHSSVAYGYASIPKSNAALQILVMNRRAVPPADLVLIFDLSPEIAISRKDQRNNGTEIFEKKETLSRVREGYLTYFPEPVAKWIDASKGKDEVSGAALLAAQDLLRK